MRIFLATIVLGLVAAFSFAQDKPAAGTPKTPSPQEIMALMQKYGTPGAEQDKLKPMVGTFDAVVTMQMDPSAPPQTSMGKMVSEMIFGGRFLEGKYTGDFMGQPFNGVMMVGFDKLKGKYTSVWVDSVSTAMMNSEGSADPSGKVITMMCTYDCPITQGKRTNKQVTTIIDDNNHTYEVYDIGPDGKETKSMTIKYTRAK